MVAGRFLGIWDVAARLLHRHWRRVGSRATADNPRKWADLPCFLLPFPSLPFSTGCKNHRYLQRGKNTMQSFRFSPLFSDLLFSVFSFGFMLLPSSGGGRL
jgi:hypothetical protein